MAVFGCGRELLPTAEELHNIASWSMSLLHGRGGSPGSTAHWGLMTPGSTLRHCDDAAVAEPGVVPYVLQGLSCFSGHGRSGRRDGHDDGGDAAEDKQKTGGQDQRDWSYARESHGDASPIDAVIDAVKAEIVLSEVFVAFGGLDCVRSRFSGRRAEEPKSSPSGPIWLPGRAECQI